MRNHTAGLEEEEERCRQCRPLLTPFIRTPLRLRSRPDGRSDTPTGNPTSRALAQIYIQQLPCYHWLMIGNGKLSFVLKPTFVKLLQSWINLTNSLTHEPTWHDGQFPSHKVQQNCKLCPRLNHNLWRAYAYALKAAISSPQGALWQTWQDLGNTKANEQPWWEWC